MENAVDANAQHHEGKFCQLTSLFLAEICDRFEGKMCEEGGQRWNLPKRSNVGKRKRKRGKEGRSWLASWTLSLPGSTNTMRAEIQCNQISLWFPIKSTVWRKGGGDGLKVRVIWNIAKVKNSAWYNNSFKLSPWLRSVPKNLCLGV